FAPAILGRLAAQIANANRGTFAVSKMDGASARTRCRTIAGQPFARTIPLSSAAITLTPSAVVVARLRGRARPMRNARVRAKYVGTATERPLVSAMSTFAGQERSATGRTFADHPGLLVETAHAKRLAARSHAAVQ